MSFADVFNVNFEPNEPVQAGKSYELQIDDVRRKTSAAGRPVAMVFFRVAGGAAPPSEIGKTLIVYFVLEGRGTVYLLPLLKACGFEKLDGQVTIEAAKLIGKTVLADVAVERSGDAAFFRLTNVTPVAR